MGCRRTQILRRGWQCKYPILAQNSGTFGRQGCAEQLVISDTLNACTADNVLQQDDDAYYRDFRQSDILSHYAYVRAVDGTGQIHARADSPPVMGFWPTSRWEAGKLVADEQVLLRPPETEPGTYRLEVGMYDPQTWAVLEPASGQRGEGGGLLLGEVTLP
jgi:hypothetical protein